MGPRRRFFLAALPVCGVIFGVLAFAVRAHPRLGQARLAQHFEAGDLPLGSAVGADDGLGAHGCGRKRSPADRAELTLLYVKETPRSFDLFPVRRNSPPDDGIHNVGKL